MENNLMAGSLQIKDGVYYIVISYKNSEGTHKQKWYSTGLDQKNNKKKADELLLKARTLFNPNDIKKKLCDLLNGDSSNLKDKETNVISWADIASSGNDNFVNEPIPDKSQNKLYQVNQVENDILFTEYLSNWLQKSKRRLEITTYATYKSNIEKRIIPYFQDKNLYLNQLKASDINAFYDSLIDKGYKTETIRRFHANIRKALVDAATCPEELLKTNIVEKLKRPEKPKNENFRAQFYSLEELNELFSVVKGHRMEVIVYLTAFYGLRREETLGLRWSAVDFANNRITIDYTITECYIDDVLTIVEKDRAKNAASLRTLPLLPEIKDVLLLHKEKLARNRKEFKRDYNKKYSEFVCVNEMGNLFKPNYTTELFKRFLRANDLRRIRFHDLRHTCASLLLSKGVPMKDIQEWLGHSSYSITADFYAHLDYSSKVKTGNILSNSGLVIS